MEGMGEVSTRVGVVNEADLRAMPDPAFSIGEVVADCYMIRAVLASGGMGHVYAADDVELRRGVAIKTAFADRIELQREAQALAQVHHPGVVSVHRFGTHRGVPFMVMERLYGSTVADHIATRLVHRTVTEVAEAIDILIGVIDGLAALHQAGIAHLDLKPANVILCGGGRVVLVDLGIMMPEVAAGPQAPAGTPPYMAPEMISGELSPGRAHHADLYAFGAMAYELLAGAPPFGGGDITSVLARHLVDSPSALHELRPDVPERLTALVHACLAKEPSDRPDGAEWIAWELRAIRTPRPGRITRNPRG
jgi:eukaryotic-like serine/threonine-protein kinase